MLALFQFSARSCDINTFDRCNVCIFMSARAVASRQRTAGGCSIEEQAQEQQNWHNICDV
eukprot:1156919-Pelagomonas_calceolata.AAC.1